MTFLLLLLMPLLLADAMVSALQQLGMTRSFGALLVLAIFAGSLFNIPVRRKSRAEVLAYRPFDFYGIDRLAPRLLGERSQQVIALNVGGCVIPLLIVMYQLMRLGSSDAAVFPALLLACALNTAACYLMARPVAGLGILLPIFVPGCLAALLALFLAPAHAPGVAFCAGVLGPLIGADLLHLRDLGRRGAGLLSIGGAGTFDGIVVSGFLAVMLSA
ncbi:MAG: DUF1614 domain-containing protein [Gammaproteobacteria bacterium]|nr:DUF1614 domain-containing protein [Gammaproteobacteria bacterium]MBK7519465.1 DUF1614 domain-containing protein [Gammaproteobacteria bacterium]MBK7729785.1 DUF1614 domain-containing protein [Gammaproteobacteria bacterium]MBK8305631.1 DUF1614 domain-containing protein [Gammaproteobacteria bacterium]MBP6227665.1 DUF1614 domain-containing protein [Pseudomonadales bacterium]